MKRATTHRGRFYDADGKKLPSVTTILSCVGKAALVAWSANVEREMVIEAAASLFDEIRASEATLGKLAFITNLINRLGKQKANQLALQKAGDIGSQAHGFIEWLLRTELCQEVGSSPQIGPEAQIAVDAWREWRKTVKFRPLFIESGVISKEFGYAGTTDLCCADIDDVTTIVDFKTGKRIYYEAHLQLAAYSHAFREMGIADCKRGILVRLPKTKEEPEFEIVVARPEDECFEVFLAVKKLWQDMQEQDKWLKEQDVKQEAATEKVACGQ